MNSVFEEQVLADKLSKLNSTQQCIETLSHWCIFHQSKAEVVAKTWDKQFHKSEMAQKVPLLYLANDILQNSKRKGNEFVTEFWKVLPAALKDVTLKGDAHGKNVVSRLVNIWEERRVFGSRTKSLNDIFLGEEAPPPLELSKKRPRSVKIMKRDSRSIRTKLSIGSAAEKIVSAYQSVLSERSNEEVEMSKCKSTVNRVRKFEKDVNLACANAKSSNRKTLAKDIEDEENLLKKCIEKLKSVEAIRVALVSQLKEALHEQESELENVRTQMQVAQAQAEEASYMQKRLNDEDYISKPSTATTSLIDRDEQTHKRSTAAIAAEVADKLAASSSSQMIMRSVLSTFAAEEAKKATTTTANSNFLTDSVKKSEQPIPLQDPNSFVPTQQPLNGYQSVLIPQPTMHNQTQPSQGQYHITQQYMQQQSGGIMAPYGYGNIAPLPQGPPPPPLHMMVHMPQQQQGMALAQPQQQQPPQQLLAPPPNFRPLQPPGMVYYNHPHHS